MLRPSRNCDVYVHKINIKPYRHKTDFQETVPHKVLGLAKLKYGENKSKSCSFFCAINI